MLSYVDYGHSLHYTVYIISDNFIKKMAQKKRHKCSVCGKVRFEGFMKKIRRTTRWGNPYWVCADN